MQARLTYGRGIAMTLSDLYMDLALMVGVPLLVAQPWWLFANIDKD